MVSAPQRIPQVNFRHFFFNGGAQRRVANVPLIFTKIAVDNHRLNSNMVDVGGNNRIGRAISSRFGVISSELPRQNDCPAC